MKQLIFLLACFFTLTANAQDYVWAKSMGGTSADEGEAVTIDAAGNMYITGGFRGTSYFDPDDSTVSLTSAGQSDIFIAKYDTSGNYIWAKRMGGTNNDGGWEITTDASGNVIVTGNFQGTAYFDSTVSLTVAGQNDFFIAKYDADGNYVWAKGIGGGSDDLTWSIAVDASGNVYATGGFEGTADFDPSGNSANLTATGQADIFLAKYDAAGNYIWAKSIGGSDVDYGLSLKTDAVGNVYMTGEFRDTVDFDPSGVSADLTAAGLNDIFIAKYDSSGNYIWAKSMGGTDRDEGWFIAADASGNLYVTGVFSGTADFDFSGTSANLVSAGSTDIFLAKYDASGNYIWAKRMGGSDVDEGYPLASDASGNVYLAGRFSGTAFFDTSDTVGLTSAGGSDIFLAKYDTSGNYLSAKSMGGSGDDFCLSIATDASDNVYVTGSFRNTADFDPSGNSANLTSAGQSDIFIAKYHDATTTSVEPSGEVFRSSVSVYPNPAHSILTIQTNETIETISIYDVAGALVQTETQPVFSIAQLQPGVYLVHVKTENGVAARQMVKE